MDVQSSFSRIINHGAASGIAFFFFTFLRGRATVRMKTDEIMALTRGV